MVCEGRESYRIDEVERNKVDDGGGNCGVGGGGGGGGDDEFGDGRVSGGCGGDGDVEAKYEIRGNGKD